MTDQALDSETETACARLGIHAEVIRARGLVSYPEATELVLVERVGERDFHLAPPAAAAWRSMRVAAAKDGIALLMVSAYRSVARQIEIIEHHLAQGKSIDEVLSSVAPPGYSEHHTGRAIDIGSNDHPHLAVTFAQTRAYAWLMAEAAGFGFTLSYPEGNPTGYQYEPWHWCFAAN